jgi:hypothetical protein
MTIHSMRTYGGRITVSSDVFLYFSEKGKGHTWVLDVIWRGQQEKNVHRTKRQKWVFNREKGIASCLNVDTGDLAYAQGIIAELPHKFLRLMYINRVLSFLPENAS